MSFDKIFAHVSKKAEEDPSASIYKATDVHLASRILYGIPSGLPQLDISLRRPGLPAGRVVEYYGFEKCGKTTAALHAIANAQRMGGGGMFIDTEFSFDPERAQECGIDIEKNFAPAEASTIEGAFRILDSIIEGKMACGDNAPLVVAIDSISAVEPEKNLTLELGAEARPGEVARCIKRCLRFLMNKIAKSNITPILINHSIEVIGASKYQKQSRAGGGRALKFYSTVRVEFTSGADLTTADKKKRLGQKVFVKIEKLKNSKLEYPKMETELLNDGGFNLEYELLEAGKKTGWIEHKAGAKTHKLDDVEFTKATWPEVIATMGGSQEAYKKLLKWATANDVISPWSVTYT